MLVEIWNDVRYRVQALFRRADLDRELELEIDAHLEREAAVYERQGMTPDEARRQARLAFGAVQDVKERSRDARGTALFESLVQDVRYGSRLLVRYPLFTLTAALSLAVCIGANTTVFTLVNRLLLREPPGVVEPHRLVDIAPTDGTRFREPVVHPMMLDGLRRHAALLEEVYGYIEVQPLSLRAAESAEIVFGAFVTTNYFSALGVRPAIGRLFTSDDREEPGESPIAVLSHAAWLRRFDGDPSVLGRTLEINGQAITVVGVAAKAFRGTSVALADIWLPTSMASPTGSLPLAAGGRLRPGVSIAQAAAEVQSIAAEIQKTLPGGPIVATPGIRDRRADGLGAVAASPLPPVVRGLVAGLLTLLMGMVSLVLAIACANVAGVLLARGTTRRREIAVRLAIGAGRRRLVRQLLTETLLLFAIGGAAGVVLARLMTTMIVRVLPPLPVPIDTSLPLDWRVLLFTAGLSLLAAVVCGLVPALQSSRADVVSALKSDGPGVSDRGRLRHTFLVAQVAVSVVLVVAAGLFVGATRRAAATDTGFDPHGVEAAALDLSLAGYSDATGPAFVQDLVARIQALPNVADASAALLLPRGGQSRLCCGVTVQGAAPPDGEERFHPSWNSVEPGFFGTLRIPLLAGRDFTGADRARTEFVVIVSEAAARSFWPGEDAIGKHVLWHTALAPGSGYAGGPGLVGPNPNDAPRDPIQLTVVGVVGDMRTGTSQPPALLYVPFQQRYQARVSVVARSRDSGRLARDIRAIVADIDPRLPVMSSSSLADVVSPVLLQLRLAAVVSATAGLIGMVLAAIGVYGVATHTVARRTREIGIRIAMGAQRADVVGLVLRQGMSLVLVGAALGLALAAIAGKLLANRLFGIPPIAPLTFAAAAALFAVVGMVACYVPVRRAARISPVDALRHE